VERYDGDTHRAVYTVQFREIVYVLHAFQKNRRQVSRRRRGTSI
jgi:phage-related protein